MRRVYIKAVLVLEMVCCWIYKGGGFLMHDLLLIFHTCGEAMCLCRLVDFGLYVIWKKKSSSPQSFSSLKSSRIFRIIL